MPSQKQDRASTSRTGSKVGDLGRGIALHKPRPERHEDWRVRYADPDSGKLKTRTLPAAFRATPEKRATWVSQLARQLDDRRRQLERGAPRQGQQQPLRASFELFVASIEHDRRPETVRYYKHAINVFCTWAESLRITDAFELKASHLAAYRDARIAAPHSRTRDKNRRRSRHTVAAEINLLRPALNHLRKLGHVHLTRDEIADTLENVRAPSVVKEVLFAPAIASLLRGIETHEPAMLPFTKFVLLTGVRLNEAVTLAWDDVDLERGRVTLRPENVKTKRGRVIDLSVCPSVVVTLGALPRIGDNVFGLTRKQVQATLERLKRVGVVFGWHMLRRTCGTHLANALGIWGARSAHKTARQLGHTIAVCERSYLSRDIVNIPITATTLEAAMQLL